MPHQLQLVPPVTTMRMLSGLCFQLSSSKPRSLIECSLHAHQTQPPAYVLARCSCGKNEEDGRLMLCCDSCETWQHGRCAGIRSSRAAKQAPYLCYMCLGEAGAGSIRLREKAGSISSQVSLHTPACAKHMLTQVACQPQCRAVDLPPSVDPPLAVWHPLLVAAPLWVVALMMTVPHKRHAVHDNATPVVQVQVLALGLGQLLMLGLHVVAVVAVVRKHSSIVATAKMYLLQTMTAVHRQR